MTSHEKTNIESAIAAQEKYFVSGITKDTAHRKKALKIFNANIKAARQQIFDALKKDLHKSYAETYLTEVSIVLHELKIQIRNLEKWSRTEKRGTPLFLWPSKSRIVKEPYGKVLVIAPWNYPFQLSLVPLVTAVAAGNTVLLKPSHKTPETSKILNDIITRSFDPGHAACITGHTEVSTFLLEKRFDYIFFTGSPRVGKIVMEAAAKNLTPVTLELGGKSPCIVDSSADLDLAAKRIIWGKLINAGQTCIAPDYVLAREDVKEELIEHMAGWARKFYGDDPSRNKDYPRIITAEATEKLAGQLEGHDIVHGGSYNINDRYFSPTILDEPSPESPVMQEEIFGPVLPVLTFKEPDEAITFVNSREKPLALYFFGDRKKGMEVIGKTSSGGACINDVLLHIANPHLPFGGVGNSGMGAYHARAGFDTFTHKRSVLSSSTKIDIKLKYPPFGDVKKLEKLM